MREKREKKNKKRSENRTRRNKSLFKTWSEPKLSIISPDVRERMGNTGGYENQKLLDLHK